MAVLNISPVRLSSSRAPCPASAKATARALHAAGAHPVLAARRPDRLQQLSDQLDGALAVPTDVTDPAARRALISATLDRHGRIDGLVNNAGAGILKLLVETSRRSSASCWSSIWSARWR